MSAIDKIMGAIGRHGDDCIRDADAASESFEALRELIAAALADAERRGAEAMREAADQLRADADEIFPPSDRGRQAPVEVRDVVEWYSESIRALPLPTGPRQAVLLTDKQIENGRKQVFSTDNPFCPCDAKTMRKAARWAEAAALAANNLEVRRG